MRLYQQGIVIALLLFLTACQNISGPTTTVSSVPIAKPCNALTMMISQVKPQIGQSSINGTIVATSNDIIPGSLMIVKPDLNTPIPGKKNPTIYFINWQITDQKAELIRTLWSTTETEYVVFLQNQTVVSVTPLLPDSNPPSIQTIGITIPQVLFLSQDQAQQFMRIIQSGKCATTK